MAGYKHNTRANPHSTGPTLPLPKSWPHNSVLEYISRPVYSDKLDNDMLSSLHDCPNTPQLVLAPAKKACQAVYISRISDSRHPAYNQFGLFARQNIAKNCFILFYIGLVHGSADTDESSDYDLSMDRELGISVDASKIGNEARFINDFRGIADRPNAEFQDCWIKNGQGMMERRIGVFVHTAAQKGIRKGEEILVSYGKGFWKERSSDHEMVQDRDFAK